MSIACVIQRHGSQVPASPHTQPHRMRETQTAAPAAQQAAQEGAQQQPATKKQKSNGAAWKAGVGYGHKCGR